MVKEMSVRLAIDWIVVCHAQCAKSRGLIRRATSKVAIAISPPNTAGHHLPEATRAAMPAQAIEEIVSANVAAREETNL